jgi:seryl-tRNA synthetase
MKNDINWAWVAEAIDDYIWCGYKYLEVPWIVSNEAVQATIPAGRLGWKTFIPDQEVITTDKASYLVGSAEQSFIQLMINGALDKGRYCAATPCFRDDKVDDLHQQTFFKVELIEFRPDSDDLSNIIDDAKEFMEYLSACKLDIVKTEAGLDLMLKGVEVGSYGYRQYKEMKWIYGTGLALPRFSKAVAL